jgi:hypothetical protein
MAFAAACAVKNVFLRMLSRTTVVFEFRDLQERLRCEDASIVEQHIQTAELVHRRLYNGLADRRH